MGGKAYVSIIMAAFNAERTIGLAIDSVVHQSFENWELIIIDDGSNDSTVAIVNSKRDSRIRLIKNERNLGVSKSRKVGLDIAEGEWIAILDSDDAWRSDKLEKQLNLQKATCAEVVFTGSAFMDNDGNPLSWTLSVPEKLTYRELLKQNLISNSSVLVKKSLYKQNYVIGDELHEDFAIWLNITKEGKIAYGINEPLLIYRLTKSSKSSNKLKAAVMNWKTYRYVGLNPFSAFYYMCWYIIKSIKKYKNLI